MEICRLHLGSIANTTISEVTPYNGYIIKHPAGVVMIDTGFGGTLGSPGLFGELVSGDRAMQWVRRLTTDALADHGVEPGDVKLIINTHLGDHSGENFLFPEATFIVQRPEVEWHRAGHNPHAPEARRAWDFPGARIEQLAAEDASVVSGVECLFTPGHTPGHQCVLVDGADGRTLFMGDAAYTYDIWADPDAIEPGHPAFGLQVQDGRSGDASHLEQWRTSVAKLAAVDADSIHFAHDERYVHRATSGRP